MKKIILFVLIFLFCLPAGRVFADMFTGTIDSAQKYAWSTGGGWISFGCNKCNVRVDDTEITGYVWSQNYGWINLSPAQSGVKNTGDGVLSGYAWGQNSGWINFAGVTINSSGRFVGTATDQANGTINFNCDGCEVVTDWRPVDIRAAATGGRTYGSASISTVLSPPVAGFKVSINNGAEATNKRTVILYLDGGPDTLRMEASNSPDFKNVTEAYERAKTWVLEPGDGKKTVYVKFFGANGAVSEVLQDSIVLDTLPPKVKLDKEHYEFDFGQDAVISGTTDKSLQIFLDWGASGGIANFEKGRWLLNLGKMSPGDYSISLNAQDANGNGTSIDVSMKIKEESAPKEEKSVIARAKEVVSKITEIFRPKLEAAKIVTVPKEAPMSMSGKISLMPQRTIEKLAAAPLPEEIKVLASKFPQLDKTFKEIGISKFSNVTALRNSNLTLPSLGEIVTPPPEEAVPGEFIGLPATPTSKLTATEKFKVPTDIVFVRTADGLVDFNAVLSVDEQGVAEQKIKTVAGAPLELIVRPDKSAKSVKAYIILKSRKQLPEPVSSSGLKNLAAALVSPVFASTAEQPEEKMVLGEINFQDSGGGLFVASTNAPVVDGEYEIVTVIEYEDIQLGNKQVRLISVVDPEGYVYQKTGELETRVSGSVVSLYWLNPNTKQYELWPAKNFQQENPQTTDSRGSYSFLVPNGYYYLSVFAPGYQQYDGKPFQVSDGSGIHINIELKTKFWWLNFFDWKNILIFAVFLLLLYNFYRDRARETKLLLKKT